MKLKRSTRTSISWLLSVLLSMALSWSLMPSVAFASVTTGEEDSQIDLVAEEPSSEPTDEVDVVDPEPLLGERQIGEGESVSAETPSDSSGLNLVEFLYVDEEEVKLGSDETIVVTFSQPIDAPEFVLRYQKLGEDTVRSISSTNKTSDAASFVIHFADESDLGDYRLMDISWGGSNAGVYEVPYAEKIHSFSVVRQSSVAEDASETTIIAIDENGSLNESDEVSDALTMSEEALEAEGLDVMQAATRVGNVVVALDPGHGGNDGGASANGIVEKNVNLKIAQYCRDELLQYNGVSVCMTRDADVRPASPTAADLDARVNTAIRNNANVFVSIHNNSAGESAYGFEVYYQNESWKPGLSTESKQLAQRIESKLAALGLYDRGIKIRNSENNSRYPDGSLADYYGLLSRCKAANIPAMIVEHAFLTNHGDAEKLKDDSFLRKLGIADAQAIAEHYGLSKGRWERQPNGTWKYNLGNLGYVVNEWRLIGGDWYYFDQNGVMCTGWMTIGNHTYYLRPGSDGRMVTGINTIDGKTYLFASAPAGYLIKGQWYYLDGANRYALNDGTLASGKVLLDGETFYFTKEGTLAQGWLDVNGEWFYVENGIPIKGWVQEGSNRFYLHPDTGAMQTGLQEVDGRLCLFRDAPNGSMATGLHETSQGTYRFLPEGGTDTGWVNEGGRWYYLDPEDGGRAATGWKGVGSGTFRFDDAGRMLTGWQLIDGEWHYFAPAPSGAMQRGWLQLGGHWYYLDPDTGAMFTGFQEIGSHRYLFRDAPNGTMVTGWAEIDGEWHYFAPAPSGAMQRGWLKEGGRWYYLDPDTGAMLTGWLELDGRTYYANPAPSGALAEGWKAIGGKWYYFGPGCAMLRSQWVDWKWLGEDGAYDPSMTMMPIMGYSNITADKLASAFLAHSSYPAMYAHSDAPTAKRFFEILIEEANAEGVRADVVAGQSMLETGWLQFGGIVLPQQYNFAGLGALDGNATGNAASFASIREGLRAQVQHLKAYATASNIPLNNPCVDPRFNYVRRGAAPYVEWLGIQENPQHVGWASAKDYGMHIVSLIRTNFS